MGGHSRKPSLKRKFGEDVPGIELPTLGASGEGSGAARESSGAAGEPPEASNPKRRTSDWSSKMEDKPDRDNDNDRYDNDSDEAEEFEMLLDPQHTEDGEEGSRPSDGDGAEPKPRPNGPAVDDENSPYAEVRAAVPNYDEDLPCNTLRAWVIGLGLVTIGASANTIFSLRQPSISVGPLIAQLISWVMGKAWEHTIPDRQLRLLGVTIDLNPGPFNVKEHSIIVVMANVSFSVAYATDIILAQKIFYKQDFGVVFQLLLVISSQSIGYGIAGTMRKFLVYPASMIWPGNLASVVLMNSMYEKDQAPDPTVLGGTMSRFSWFGMMTLFSFAYFFIPGFFAQFLSVFAFATWLAPQNPVVNQLFGGTTGLSILPLTLDWTQISGYVGSPMVPPWPAIANTLIGVVVFFVFGSAITHYGGAWYSEYLPMSDSSTYDNTGQLYDTARVLTSDFTLNEEAYKAYSPLFLSTTFALCYGLSFAAISSLIVYIWLNHRKTIWAQFRNSTTERPDIHMKLMRKYPEAPTWWYLSLFVVVIAMGLYCVLAWPTNLSWWAFLLAIAISFTFSLPIGIIQAITNNQIGLNVLTEFVYGYIQPGRPLALMLFKVYGFIATSQALRFVEDLKFGHYMKIPPRTMFMCQVVATTMSCFIQVAVLNFALDNIPGVCEANQPEHFTCPGGRVFYAASVIWGLLGPGRMFSPGQVYSSLFWFFPLGGLVPIILHFLAKRNPGSKVYKNLMAPLIFGGAGAIPPATPLNYLSWGLVGYVFQSLVRRRYFAWWSRLNYLTSSGLDLGLALGTMVLFFATAFMGAKAPEWWGNNVVTGTMDYQGTAVQTKVSGSERFGPVSW